MRFDTVAVATVNCPNTDKLIDTKTVFRRLTRDHRPLDPNSSKLLREQLRREFLFVLFFLFFIFYPEGKKCGTIQ